MDEDHSTVMLAGMVALVLAGVIAGLVLLRNWLAADVVAHAVSQPAYVFPTTDTGIPAMLTPFSVGTPLFDQGSWYWSTPTPVHSDVIITTP